jgi:L,D-transpeptidase YcbB
MRALVFVLLCLFALPAEPAADPLDLGRRLEVLGTAAAPTIAGEPIAATALLQRFYAARDDRPAWSDPETAAALLAAIEASSDDGLAPGDFHAAAVGRLLDEAVSAEREIVLTDALARLLYQLSFGKVDPRRLDPNWNFARPTFAADLISSVSEALDAGDVEGLVARARLAHPTYQGLRRGLARYRQIAAAGGWRALPQGPTLELGAHGPAVAILRERLMAAGDLNELPVAARDRLDPPMEAAIRRFQVRHGLAVDGRVGPATRAAMNVPVEQRIAQLRVNLERARWVLRLDPPDRIEVDIAGFSVERRRDGAVTWQSRAVVGRPFRQTPVFADEIRYIDFNPTWTVPRSILVKDIMPLIRENRAYLAEQNFDVVDSEGRSVSLEVATRAVLDGAAFPWTLVQRPGPLNALGRMKFMFPNEFAVYLHDTPARELFGWAARPFSSGCIRVQDSMGLAELLLADNPGWDRARIEAVLAGGETRRVFLQRPMPVRLLYRTADLGADGSIHFRADIYDRDGPLLAALDAPFRPVFPRFSPRSLEREGAGAAGLAPDRAG